MKNLILASLLSIVSVSAGAEAISAALGTTATAVTSFQVIACAYTLEDSECRQALSSASVSLLAAVLKEDMKQVEPDALNFLAGEEISLALKEQMEVVRQSTVEASELSDQELAVAIIQIANVKE